MPARSYDFWLFDLDGTLVDIEPEHPRRVLDRMGERLGHRFTDREVEILWYGVGEGRQRLLADLEIDPERFWKVFHEVEDPEVRAQHTYLYDDAAVVGSLDCPTGLVTHCQSYLTDPILEELDIGDWFDTVVCCSDEIGWKPDPSPVERAMTDLGVSPGSPGALAGDDPADTGAAWNAGLDAVHVNRVDPHTRGQCVRGDLRVNTLDRALAGHGDPARSQRRDSPT